MAILVPLPKFYATDNNGRPVPGGKLFTYQAGTNTKLGTYTTASGGVANTNPVVMDSAGRANVWIRNGSRYKYVFSPANDTDPPTNPFWTVDNIGDSGAPWISVTDYGAVADNSTDNSAAFTAAIAACSSQSVLVIPEGTSTYNFATGITFPATLDGLTIIWMGRLKYTGTSGTAITFGDPASRFDFLNIIGRGIYLDPSSTDWSNNVIGTLWYGTFYANVNVQRICGFGGGGIKFLGNATVATEYAKFYLTLVSDNKIDIWFAGEADNQNEFFGGQTTVTASAHAGHLSGSCGIKSEANNNNNTFIGTSMEAAGLGTKEYKFDIDGEYFSFINCRYEGQQSKAQGRLGVNSFAAWLIGGTECPNFRTDNSVVNLGLRNNCMSEYLECKDNQVIFRPGTRTRPATGNWISGDQAIYAPFVRGQQTGAACITTGTFGSLGALTATTTINTKLVTFNSVVGLARNQWINIVGVTGPLMIADINSLVVTLNSNADASVIGAAVTWNTPVWTDLDPAWDILPSAYSNNEGYITWDPGNLVDGDGETSSAITVTGLTAGYSVVVVPPYDLQGVMAQGYYQQSGQARIRLQNETGGAVDFASGIWRVRCIRMTDV